MKAEAKNNFTYQKKQDMDKRLTKHWPNLKRHYLERLKKGKIVVNST